MPLMNLKKDTQTTAERPATFRGRVPTKADINFALVGVRKTHWWLTLIIALIVVAAVAAFAKFLVFDKLAEVSAAQAEAAAVRTQLNDTYARIDAYGELNETYAHYTYSGMTEEELGRVDRVAVLELLERVVYPRTEIDSWSLEENRLTLSITGRTLQEINETVQLLLDEELVSYCEVNTASTEAKNTKSETLPDTVTANVMVYLSKPEGGTEK